MGTLAVVVLVLLGCYVVFGSLHQHKILINKFVVIVAAVAIGILILQGSVSDKASQLSQTPAFQQIAPSVQKAPYVVQTSSRAYYVATFKDRSSALVLTQYYYYDQEKWELSDIPFPLNKSIYGNLEVVNRKIGG